MLSCVIFCLLCLALGAGCSTVSIVKDAGTLPPIVRAHTQLTFRTTSTKLVDTKIYVKEGEIISLLPDLHNIRSGIYLVRSGLAVKVGSGDASFNPPYHFKAASSGTIYLENTLSLTYLSSLGDRFTIDVLVWEKEDWVQIVEYFEKLKQSDPGNVTLVDALNEAKLRKEIFLAETSAFKAIEETKKELEELQQEPAQKEKMAEELISKGRPLSGEERKEETVEQLKARLAELTQTLARLEEMKKQLSEEREKTSQLSKELDAKEKREQELLTRLKDTSMVAPVIVVASPAEGSTVQLKIIHVSGVAEDEEGLAKVEILVNGKRVGEKEAGVALGKTKDVGPKRLDFNESIRLETGENRITVRAIDIQGLISEKTIKVHYTERRKNIWAVVIGINEYPKAPQLKYAVNDAKAFYDYLLTKTQIPPENVTLLLNHEAGLSALRSTLGTQLKNKADKEDMVILYFAGHGAIERDVLSLDGDGLEKYLLPFDADLKDLYASALPMREISHILQRIRSERLVFIIDSCYSGASGGRTVRTDAMRANISDAFLDRIVSGKGTIILTGSGANEVSAEKDELGHGVFTYFLLEGLGGKADIDRDGQITVDEAYDYVSRNVPKATGQEQHPVKKGEVEGHLILGIVR